MAPASEYDSKESHSVSESGSDNESVHEANGTNNDASKVADSTNGPKEDLAPEGSLPSFRPLYGTQDSDKKWTWKDTEPQNVAAAAETAETAQYALITRLQKAEDSRKKYEIHSIIIQSQWLKDALGEIFEGYPGVHCGLERLIFKAPFAPFVHRWNEFIQHRERKDLDDTTKAHLDVLHEVLREELKDVIKTFEDYVKHGVVTFEHLWAIFPLGELVFAQSHHGAMSALKLHSGCYVKTQCGNAYQLQVGDIDWNGKHFGRRIKSIPIYEFMGTQSILGLKMFPLSFHPQEKQIRALLTERGQKFEALAGSHYKEYKGFAISWDSKGNEVPVYCSGRIIVDSDAFGRFSDYYINWLEPLTPKEGATASEPACAPHSQTLHLEIKGQDKYVFGKQKEEKRLRLTAKHHLTCSSRARGYSLKKKAWLEFYVDLIGSITFNAHAFDALVLPEDQKELILSFAESQAMHVTTFDDVISGKGRGHITLLSGPPGVGKTLTAESVAEHMRAPLYMMSAGDLGINPDQVEERLSKILEMIAKWNAVLLLDECDVFLEKRSAHDLERNKLVSIFLRVLEYYEGILFLTTNRIDNIDLAFQSRIHISMSYPDLTDASRRVIWENFLKVLDAGGEKQRERLWTEGDLDELARVELNGRQIKNVLKNAALLSARRKEKVSRKYIDMVLAIERRRPGVAERF